MSNIFDVIGLLFTKRDPGQGFKRPSWVVLGRFLASELDFAPLAKAIALEVQDNDVAWELWLMALPEWTRAPRLNYIAPKKEKDDGLVMEVASRFALSHRDAFEAVDLIEVGGDLPRLRAYLGYQES